MTTSTVMALAPLSAEAEAHDYLAKIAKLRRKLESLDQMISDATDALEIGKPDFTLTYLNMARKLTREFAR